MEKRETLLLEIDKLKHEESRLQFLYNKGLVLLFGSWAALATVFIPIIINAKSLTIIVVEAIIFMFGWYFAEILFNIYTSNLRKELNEKVDVLDSKYQSILNN